MTKDERNKLDDSYGITAGSTIDNNYSLVIQMYDGQPCLCIHQCDRSSGLHMSQMNSDSLVAAISYDRLKRAVNEIELHPYLMKNPALQSICDGEMLRMEYCIGIKPKELAKGTYKGIQFSVTNNSGLHPCGYVDVSNTPLNKKKYDDTKHALDFISVHGGITYSESKHPMTNNKGWWIGWDYAHVGDFVGLVSSGEKHSTSEVVNECVNVINQIVEKYGTSRIGPYKTK